VQSSNLAPQVAAKLRDDRRTASTSNEIWAMDFVHGQLATGHRIRVLTVVDTFSRFSPVIDPRFSYRAEDVVTALEGAVHPRAIRRRSGSIRAPSLSAETSISGLTRRASRWTSHSPANPTNAFIEAFNGHLRAECLNAHWFLTLADARDTLEDWRKYYSEERPHGAIGNKPPRFPS
jgi:putative transposase